MLSVAVIGAGPAGCMSAINIDKDIDVTLFDKNVPLKTLLPTGGGRCNFTHDNFYVPYYVGFWSGLYAAMDFCTYSLPRNDYEFYSYGCCKKRNCNCCP